MQQNYYKNHITYEKITIVHKYNLTIFFLNSKGELLLSKINPFKITHQDNNIQIRNKTFKYCIP